MNLRKIIREEMDNMWQNLFQGEGNIWFSYEMVVFDEMPTKEEVIKLIRDAFKSGLVKQEAIDSWENEGIENEVRIITSKLRETPYLRIDLKDGWLYYGSYYEEVIKLYPELRVIKYSEAKNYLINESEEDDFTWITDVPLNPWLEYNAIIFNRKPKKKEINNYIELALSTRNPANKEAWETGRVADIKGILNYIKRYDKAALILDGNNNLVYSDPSGYKNKKINSIKYSQLVNKNLNESEEDEWSWAKESIFVDKVSMGDKVRVYNTGSEKAFLNWLGGYRENYENGLYGEYIEGVVIAEEEESFGLSVKGHEGDADSFIYFPYKSHMEFLESIDEGYDGLSISYEIIFKP